MSGHREAEQYKEQLEASRTAHAACEAARREGLEVQRVLGAQCDRNLAEIDRLRGELAGAIGACHDATEQFLIELERAEEAEARLAAVIYLCDTTKDPDLGEEWVRAAFAEEIRAAATGDTNA